MDWERVWRGDSEVEAEIVAGGLRADGFDARVVGGPPPPMPTVSLSLNTWVVVVPWEQAEGARSRVEGSGDPGAVDDRAGIDWTAHRLGLGALAAAAALGLVWLLLALASRL